MIDNDVVRAKDERAARYTHTQCGSTPSPGGPVIPFEIVLRIITFSPRSTLPALARVNTTLYTIVEPLIYRHITTDGYMSLVEDIERDGAGKARAARLAPLVRTLTYATKCEPADLSTGVSLPGLQAVRLPHTNRGNCIRCHALAIWSPRTIILDDKARPDHPAQRQFLSPPRSIIQQIQLLANASQPLAVEPDEWRFDTAGTMVIIFLPQNPTPWCSAGEVEDRHEHLDRSHTAGISRALEWVKDGWQSWYHPVTFVGAESLGTAEGFHGKTVREVLEQGLKNIIEDWWLDDFPDRGAPEWRDKLLKEEKSVEAAVQREWNMMRWITLDQYIDNELNEDEIPREEAEEWRRGWKTWTQVGVPSMSSPVISTEE